MWTGIKGEEGQVCVISQRGHSLSPAVPLGFLETQRAGRVGSAGTEGFRGSLFLGLAWTNCLVLLGASVSSPGMSGILTFLSCFVKLLQDDSCYL